jgi:hypothetical protein
VGRHCRAWNGTKKLHNDKVLKKGEIGFKELAIVLKDFHIAGSGLNELILREVKLPRLTLTDDYFSFLPELRRSLILVENGKEREVQTEMFDPDRIERDLLSRLDFYSSKKLQIILFYCVLTWFVLNSIIFYFEHFG